VRSEVLIYVTVQRAVIPRSSVDTYYVYLNLNIKEALFSACASNYGQLTPVYVIVDGYFME